MTRILVIEDEDDLRNDILETLTLEGFEAYGAENGAVGIERARELTPDLIICDIMMPQMDGYQVLQTLRKENATATIPFIFLTAKTERDDMRYGMVLGADDYLTKPFRISELLESVQSRLQKRAEMQAQAERKLENLRANIATALPHELRTPLNTIIGFSEMLISEAQYLKPDQVADWAQHIHGGAMRLFRLIENYLAYVRVEALAHQPEYRERFRNARLEDPASIVEMVAAEQANIVERRDDLHMDLQADGAIRVSNEDFTAIVQHIVSNAFKFSKSGTPVEVGFVRENDDYVLTVKDYGIGMTPEQVNAIGAYMQFDRLIREQQGSGLGLAIVRRLVELYEGDFTITSVPDDHTIVTVRLPHAT